jgi:TolB-like protein
MPGKSGNIGQFWQELKRRKVVRVITVYAAATFVILELVSIITEPLRLPEWTLALVIVILCIGFVITVILSWVYDITPEGIEKTKPVQEIKEFVKPTGSIAWKIATYVSVSVILAFVVFYLINNNKQSEAHTQIGKSIAVLPFVDMSPQKDQEYFCDGITEELINSLTHIDGLKVIARTSSFAFKGKQEDIREIGRKLDVETLLEGSVQKAGDRLRITAQLIKVEDGSHLWSQQYDRDLEDVFAIQDEISLAITDILKLKLLGDRKNSITERQTENIEAYNLYLRGRYFWNLRTEEDLKRSLQYYNQAIEHDSKYALAFAGLADAYFIMAWWDWYPRTEGYEKGREYAHKALSININIAEAHATLGAIAAWYDWNWEESVKEIKHAIALNPSSATAHQYYSETLDILRKNKEAREQINQALKLNPHSYVMYALSGMYYYFQANYEKSIEEAQKALEINDSFASIFRIFKCHVNLGTDREAIKQLIRIISKYPSSNKPELIDKIYQESGIEGIILWFIEWIQLNESTGYYTITSSNYRLANMYALIGDTQNAIKYLEKSMNIGESTIPRINNNPDFDFIRDDPRFKALLKEMQLID